MASLRCRIRYSKSGMPTGDVSHTACPWSSPAGKILLLTDWVKGDGQLNVTVARNCVAIERILLFCIQFLFPSSPSFPKTSTDTGCSWNDQCSTPARLPWALYTALSRDTDSANTRCCCSESCLESQIWTRHLPYLPVDFFFLWGGGLPEGQCETRPTTLNVFKQSILQCIEAISNDLLQRGIVSMPAKMQEGCGGDGDDLKNVTF